MLALTQPTLTTGAIPTPDKRNGLKRPPQAEEERAHEVNDAVFSEIGQVIASGSKQSVSSFNL